MILSSSRSSPSEVPCIIYVSIFGKFPGKHLCQSLFFNKVSIESLLLKRSLFHRCFPVNFVNFFYRTPLVAASDLSLITEYNIYFSMFFYKLLFLRHLLYFLIKKYIILILYSGIVFLYHLIVHYLGIWEFLLHLIFWFWKFKGIVKFQWSSLTKLFYIWKAPASKTFVLCFSNFNLAKKNLCSENRCARFLRAVCFLERYWYFNKKSWKEL